MSLVPPELQAPFLLAGWSSGRRVSVSADVPTGHPAVEVLANLAGLAVGVTGPGIECAASDISFGESPDRLPEADALEVAFESRLIAIAEIHNGHGQLLMDEAGRCFGVSLMHAATWFEGAILAAALRSLLTGLKGRPILLPGQTAVELYGQTFVEGDTALYDLTSARC